MTAAIYNFFNNRINLLLLGLALFPLFFTKYVESLCDQYLEPIYLNISSNWIVDLVSLFLCVLIVLYYLERYKKEHLLSAFRVRLLVIGTGWYIYFRLQTGWNYGHFSFWDSLYYLDSIIFLCGVNLLYCGLPRNQKTVIAFYEKIELVFVHIKWKWRRFCVKIKLKWRRFCVAIKWCTEKPSNTIKNKKRFLTDQSLKFDTSDYLGRKEYANSITTTILNTLEKDHHTFAIGIVGEWGAGKTSFFTMMKASEDIKNGKAIYIDFNPWLNHQNKDIVGNFFAELKEILGELDSKLAFQLDQYVKQLTTLDDNIYLKTIDFLTKLIFGTKSIKTIFSDINDSIARLKKPIIIFIDDLDRLDSSELVEVIKLIRVSANFKNTAFVVAYDKEYVSKAIEAITKHNQNLFLEKIFQAEFHLPTFEVKRLKNYFVEELKKVIDSNFHDKINDYFEHEQFIFDRSILTMRDVKRFVNQFQIDFNQVKEEVLFSDFMNLALIKYKHFGLYEYIKKSYDNFLIPTIDAGHLSQVDEGKIDPSLSDDDKKCIKLLFPIIHQENRIKRALNALKKTKITSNTVSMLNPMNINTYFFLRLVDGRLGFKEFHEALENDDVDHFLSAVDYWLHVYSAKEVYEKLKVDGNYDEVKYLIVLDTALRLCCFKCNCTEDSYYSCPDEDLEPVRTVLRNGRNYRGNTDVLDIVKAMFSDEDYVPIKARILDANNKGLDSILTSKERNELILEMLKGLLSSSDKFYREIWDVYTCTKDDEIARGLMLDFAKEKDIKGLFREIIIERKNSNRWTLDLKLVGMLFDNYQIDIMSLIDDLESSKLKKVLLLFFEECFNNNLNNEEIEFDFEGQLDWEFEHE